LNVLINLAWIRDEAFIKSVREEAAKILSDVEYRKDRILKKILEEMSAP